MIDDEPTDEPLDPDEVDTTLAEQAAIDTLAMERAEALGRPVIVASFAGTGKATVFDLHGLELDELRPIEVARDVTITASPPERSS